MAGEFMSVRYAINLDTSLNSAPTRKVCNSHSLSSERALGTMMLMMMPTTPMYNYHSNSSSSTNLRNSLHHSKAQHIRLNLTERIILRVFISLE